jgi:hypothetical protein
VPSLRRLNLLIETIGVWNGWIIRLGYQTLLNHGHQQRSANVPVTTPINGIQEQDHPDPVFRIPSHGSGEAKTGSLVVNRVRPGEVAPQIETQPIAQHWFRARDLDGRTIHLIEEPRCQDLRIANAPAVQMKLNVTDGVVESHPHTSSTLHWNVGWKACEPPIVSSRTGITVPVPCWSVDEARLHTERLEYSSLNKGFKRLRIPLKMTGCSAGT